MPHRSVHPTLGRLMARVRPDWLFYPLHAARRLYFSQHEIVSPRLPLAFDGLRIAYASDIHYGEYLEEARVYDLAERLNALHADLILLGGDYGDNATLALRFWEIVPALKANLAVCAAIGNHDLANGDPAPLIDTMYARGVTPLVNNSLTLSCQGARLLICATDDFACGLPDEPSVAAQARDAEYVLYMPHSPDALPDAFAASPDRPFFDLALCGHTHGGQVTFFGFAPFPSSRRGLRFGNRYRSGEIRERGVDLLISNGVGVSCLPVRMGAPPQYHLITLRRGAR